MEVPAVQSRKRPLLSEDIGHPPKKRHKLDQGKNDDGNDSEKYDYVLSYIRHYLCHLIPEKRFSFTAIHEAILVLI